MKLAEKLSEIQRKESKLMRCYDLRKGIANKEFKNIILNAGDSQRNLEELDNRERGFIENKKEKIAELNKKIDDLISEILEAKNKVNKLNIEHGIDKDLIQMKYIRIELSKLMKLVERRFLSSYSIDIDMYEELDMSDRIKELENKKAKLESQIQRKNWSIDYE